MIKKLISNVKQFLYYKLFYPQYDLPHKWYVESDEKFKYIQLNL